MAILIQQRIPHAHVHLAGNVELGERVFVVQVGQQPGYGGGVIQQVVDHDIHLVLYTVVDLPQFARHGVQPGVPLAAALQQILSGRRQVDGAGGADKQLRADALFQRFDAVADGGGGFVQQLRRAEKLWHSATLINERMVS